MVKQSSRSTIILSHKEPFSFPLFTMPGAPGQSLAPFRSAGRPPRNGRRESWRHVVVLPPSHQHEYLLLLMVEDMNIGCCCSAMIACYISPACSSNALLLSGPLLGVLCFDFMLKRRALPQQIIKQQRTNSGFSAKGSTTFWSCLDLVQNETRFTRRL
jgi:hypothetical protein